MKIYDLRSDTVTLPSRDMRKAMYRADVGDDVYGEDPSINALQELACRITGKGDALFVPSGSMANLIAIYLGCGRGCEVITQKNSHIVHYELGSAAAIAGATVVPVPAERGILSPESVAPFLRDDPSHNPMSKMIEIENTHNREGGTCYKLDELKRTGKILVDGAEAGSFHQFLRLRLRTADRFRLRADLQAFAEEVAARLREREQRVQEARRDVAENGPVAFPEGSAAANVYTAHGRWGRLATALEDAELRGRYFELAEHLNNAVAWFEAAKLTGIRLDTPPAPDLAHGHDRIVVADPSAPPLWARFYEIGTNRPIFGGRDTVVRYSLAEVERDGRNLIYRASLRRMDDLLSYLTDHCCQGAGCAPTRPRGRTRSAC